MPRTRRRQLGGPYGLGQAPAPTMPGVVVSKGQKVSVVERRRLLRDRCAPLPVLSRGHAVHALEGLLKLRAIGIVQARTDLRNVQLGLYQQVPAWCQARMQARRTKAHTGTGCKDMAHATRTA